MTFTVLQLVAFNDGIRLSNTSVSIGRRNRKPGTLKSCPRNSKLEALRKALGLVTKRVREKRGIFGFPIDCLHVGIVEFDDGPQFFEPLYDCCTECHYPGYLGCILEGNPDWLCASRAYKCICDCRETHLSRESVGLLTRPNVKLPKKKFKSDRFCKKKICNRFAGNGCCIENRCIKLFIHKKKSPVRQ